MTTNNAIAAIDIGTSSVHLAIAVPVTNGRPELLAREKHPVRLGSGPSDMKTLNPEAIERAIDALTDFRALADAHGAEVVAVATSAVREAENPEDFLERARHEAGITVEVIPGVEEARLIHLGVLGALPIASKRHLVIDIGGGSTEVIIGEGTTPEFVRSFKVGHVRLTDRFFPGGETTPQSIEQCRTYVRSFLARLAVTAQDHPFTKVAVCSGTWETMSALARSMSQVDIEDTAVTRAMIDAATERVLACTTAVERSALPGVEPHRSDTIAAGAILAQTLMEVLGIESFELSPDALREGLVLDRLHRRDPDGTALHHLDEIRASSVLQVASRHGENIDHARQSTNIALQLFDGTAEIHGFGEFERDVLEAAGMLHNIGRFVGHGAHHRHSYYLIRNSEHLAGFNKHELELIAQVARYHRKSEPKPSHGAFRDLSGVDQQRVIVLAGMLRVGIGLDRTYRNMATEFMVCLGDDAIELRVVGEHDELELEIFAARQRKGLLERGLNRSVHIDAVPRDEKHEMMVGDE